MQRIITRKLLIRTISDIIPTATKTYQRRFEVPAAFHFGSQSAGGIVQAKNRTGGTNWPQKPWISAFYTDDGPDLVRT